MIKNMTETALNKAYKVTPDSTTSKIQRFYKGVWGMSLPRHLLAVVDLITVAVVTFSMLIFRAAVQNVLKSFVRSGACYHTSYKRRDCRVTICYDVVVQTDPSAASRLPRVTGLNPGQNMSLNEAVNHRG